VRVGPRGGVGPACVTGGGRGGVGAAGHRRGPCTTPRGCRLSPIQSVDRPRQPLWSGDRGVVVAGTLSWGRDGPPSSWSSRDGRGRHVTQRGGYVAVGGFRGWKGRGPSAVDSTPPGAPPQYPDSGNDLSESRGDRICSRAGFFPRGFPNPPTTCLNFSLWRDLSVWRIWGGYFSRWRSGWGGVY